MVDGETKTGLTTEERNERSLQLDRLSTLEIVQIMNSEDRKVAEAVERAIPDIVRAIDPIVETLANGGRLFYVGAGTSGRLGILDASECPPTFGVSPELVQGIIAGGQQALVRAIENVEDDGEQGARDIRERVTAKDAVVGISASGRTSYVLGAIGEANRIGAVTVGISCNAGTPLSEAARYAIEVPVGPEVVTGSTRLKAGTAQKMVLNMISTTAMIKLGKVYGNLMVNVQATNRKLKERVIRIICDATDVDPDTARNYCGEANGDARIAILMIKFGISRLQAEEVLAGERHHFGNAMRRLTERRN
jgi:N-acetylmuramic acid 6-phosphate etherase